MKIEFEDRMYLYCNVCEDFREHKYLDRQKVDRLIYFDIYSCDNCGNYKAHIPKKVEKDLTKHLRHN